MEPSAPSASSVPPTALNRLPPELILSILSACTLESAVALADTSKALRLICTDNPAAWVHPLHTAAEHAGIHLRRPASFPPASTSTCDALVAASSSSRVPAAAWTSLLPILSRHFLLFSAELPRLSNAEYRDVCTRRFPSALVTHDLNKEVSRGGPGPDRKGWWREMFLRTLSRLEHRDLTFCAQEDHNCRYVVLHRKAGLTRNRISTREFDALRIFDGLKRENSLMQHTTIELPIEDDLLPVDVRLTALVVIGRADAFLSNRVAMELLDHLGGWDKGQGSSTHAILGPILFTTTIRSSPDSSRAPIAPQSVCSFDIEDLFQLGGRVGLDSEWWTSRCTVKDGAGFR